MKKRCDRCKQILDSSLFNKNQHWCRNCQKQYMKQYRPNHKEEVIDYNKNYKQEHKDEIKKYNKKHKLEHKKEINIYNKTYVQANPEKEYKRHKKYRENNRDKIRKKQRKYYLRKYQLSEKFTIEEWKQKADSTNGICPLCTRPYSEIYPFCATMDHTPPVSRAPIGFVYTIDNVNPMCGSCNSSKNNSL